MSKNHPPTHEELEEVAEDCLHMLVQELAGQSHNRT